MATLAPTYTSQPTSPSFTRRRRSWLRRCERACCSALSYFPLTFVYGLTTWACWVEVNTSLLPPADTPTAGPTRFGLFTAALGFTLYCLANISYTTAVFTDPGSPLNPPKTKRAGAGRGGNYSSLPTHEPEPGPEDNHNHGDLAFTSLTAKSDGQARFCKKCAVTKPDRSHHCSTCNRCVLKMDHHCPWLATCVGLYNYKAFLLFLSYTSIFCWVCFPISASWVWNEIVDDSVEMDEGLMVVNVIMLAVLSGIIGLVLSGFTGWHLYLATRGQTTIESLEKTRYLSPLKKSMERQFKRHGHGANSDERHFLADEESNGDDGQTMGEQLREIHANALPGITRPEEGTSRTSTPFSSLSPSATPNPSFARHSPAQASLSNSYAALERQRENDRYTAYLDELDSEKLPHAFNLGWRRNLLLLFGPSPLLWFLPVCNTQGDGWKWEVSPEWIRRRDELAAERKRRDDEEEARSLRAGWGVAPERSSSLAASPQDYWNQPYSHGAQAQGAGRHYQQQNQTQHHQTPWTPSWTESDDQDLDHDGDIDAEMDGDGDGGAVPSSSYLTTTNGVATVPRHGRRSPNKADLLLGRPSGVFNDGDSFFERQGVGSPFRHGEGSRGLLKKERERERAARNDRRGRESGAEDEYDTSSDEAESARKNNKSSNENGNGSGDGRVTTATGDWNDIPESMLLLSPNPRGRKDAGGLSQKERDEEKSRSRERVRSKIGLLPPSPAAGRAKGD